MAAASTTNCVMMQLQYRNARTVLKLEMTKLRNRLAQAKTDLDIFKYVRISLRYYGALLVTLATHHDMLQRKIPFCNDVLRKLHSSIKGVTTEEQKGQ